MATTEKQWGVSPPLSVAAPTEQDHKLNDALIAELKAQNNFPPHSDTERRDAILAKLKKLLRQMVQIVGKKQGLPQAILDAAGGEVYTYGSYRLGVYGPGSDIDTLMLAPKHVDRDHFFEHMPDLLRNGCGPSELTSLVCAPGAGVPIIKLTLQGVDIDLIFSNLQVPSVPDQLDLTDDNLLRGLDDTDIRCVNGTRVTNRILQLVPQTKVFKTTLRVIKLWAQQRAIYGNVVGYPGGVAWAILVARVCQLYPKAIAPLLVQRFFLIVRKWTWPKPVFLQHKQPTTLQVREWDPSTSRRDAAHLMPVLTPAVPAMNTTHTITRSTKLVIMREVVRAEKIVEEIYKGEKPWSALFERTNFFTEAFKHYICVNTAAQTQDAEDAWSGLVESKIKLLIPGIENCGSSIEYVQPYKKGVERVHECQNEEQIAKVKEGSVEYQIPKDKAPKADDTAKAKKSVALQAAEEGAEVPQINGSASAESQWPQKVWTTTFYIGIGLKKGPANLDMSDAVRMFESMCKGWDQYNADLHSITVKHIRKWVRFLIGSLQNADPFHSYDLPADVFMKGETRPQKPKKKAAKAEPASNKRDAAAAGLDVNVHSLRLVEALLTLSPSR